MQKYVASIFFDDTRVDRAIYGGHFVLPAVPRGASPFILAIPDHIQMEDLPFISGGGRVPRVILGEHIAADVVEHVAMLGRGMSVDCGPGVWVVRDQIPMTDQDGAWIIDANNRPVAREATEAEKQQMFAEDHAFALRRQDAYCQLLIGQGDSYAASPQGKEIILITPRMKKACIHAQREREWLTDLKDGDMKLCSYCMKSIDSRAIKCPHCSEVVDVVKHAALQAARKRAEKEALQSA